MGGAEAGPDLLTSPPNEKHNRFLNVIIATTTGLTGVIVAMSLVTFWLRLVQHLSAWLG